MTISLAKVLSNRLGCRARTVTPRPADPLLLNTALSPAVSLSELGNFESDNLFLTVFLEPRIAYLWILTAAMPDRTEPTSVVIPVTLPSSRIRMMLQFLSALAR